MTSTRGPPRPSRRFWGRRSGALSTVLVAATGLAVAPDAGRAQSATAGGTTETVVGRALESTRLPTLASGLIDTIGGRLSGTADGRRAERWAAGWLRDFGFDSVRYEPVEMPVWTRGETAVRVVVPAALRDRTLAALAYGYSPGITADSIPVVDIGRGEPGSVQAAGRAVRGAAILTDVVNPGLIDAAVRAGAEALLRVSFEPGRLAQARVAPVDRAPAPIPILSLSYEDGTWLRRQLATGPLRLRLRSGAETYAGTASNVVAELRGSDPAVADQVVLLGAHLDAWDVGDGAIDNGTGVLAALVAAGAIAADSARPRRTVRVVLFAGEELGLRGSRAYVEAHAGELRSLVAMMNLDMVGTPQGYGATGHPEADTVFARLARSRALRPLELSTEVEHGGGPGSDHQPFLMAGVPTIYVRTGLPPDVLRWYHNAGDTLDKIELETVRATGAAAAAAVWELADHSDRVLRHLSPEETQALIRRLGWIK